MKKLYKQSETRDKLLKEIEDLLLNQEIMGYINAITSDHINRWFHILRFETPVNTIRTVVMPWFRSQLVPAFTSARLIIKMYTREQWERLENGYAQREVVTAKRKSLELIRKAWFSRPKGRDLR